MSGVIEVDVNRPENNREVFIIPMEGIEGNDKTTYYYGFGIALSVDMRHVADDITEDPYKAVLHNNSSILISMPAFPYSFLQEETFTDMKNKKLNLWHDHVMDAAHYYNNDKTDREVKHLLLQFPKECKLSVEPIMGDNDDGITLPMELFEQEIDHPKMIDVNNEYWMLWKIVRLDQKAKRKGKLNSQKQIGKTAQLFKGLKLTSGPSVKPGMTKP